MDVGVIMWVYRLSTVYLSLWTQRQADPGTTTMQTETTRETNFTAKVDRCLERFQILRNHIEPFFYNGRKKTMYFYIYRQTYCELYGESLQCLHELLLQNRADYATEVVQQRLSQPWALRTNQLCNINVKKQTDQQLPDQLKQLPEQLKQLPDQLKQLPEQLTKLPEQLKKLPEQLKQLPEQLKQLPEQSTKLPEQSTKLPEQFKQLSHSGKTAPGNLLNLKFKSDTSQTTDNERTAGSKLTNLLLRNALVPQKNNISYSDKTIVQQENTHTSKAVATLLRKNMATMASITGNHGNNVQEFVKDVKGRQQEKQLTTASKSTNKKQHKDPDALYFKLFSRHS